MSEYNFDDNNQKTISKIAEALYENLLDKFPENDEFYEMERIIFEEQKPIIDNMIRRYIESNIYTIADEVWEHIEELIS